MWYIYICVWVVSTQTYHWSLQVISWFMGGSHFNSSRTQSHRIWSRTAAPHADADEPWLSMAKVVISADIWCYIWIYFRIWQLHLLLNLCHMSGTSGIHNYIYIYKYMYIYICIYIYLYHRDADPIFRIKLLWPLWSIENLCGIAGGRMIPNWSDLRQP